METHKYDDPKAAFVEAERRIQETLKSGANELDLSGLGLLELPDGVRRLDGLQKLDISNNVLTVSLESLASLRELLALNVSYNQLRSVPDSIAQLTQLQALDLSYNQLTSLSDSLSQLTELQVLRLSYNRLTLLPESVGQLTQLPMLDLTSNLLMALPNSFVQLTALQLLLLSYNQLTLIPESLGGLTRLVALDLSRNRLTMLPESIGRLSLLRQLNLSNNQLEALPESVGRLIELRTLDLSNNLLTEVVACLGQLARLQTLNISYNRLTSVPQSIGRLTQLQTLNLSNNRMTLIPESIGRLTQLEEFHAANNHLISLPQSLRDLSALQVLSLDGNDSLALPTSVLGLNLPPASDRGGRSVIPAAILDYYFRVRADRRSLNEAKLILIGRGGVGKTSIVNRLVLDRFDKNEAKTEGICILEWRLRVKGGEDVRLNLWDFGGQEIMHATHQFFLTQRSLYLLVLEGRQGAEDADAEYWLKLIESFSTESGGEVSPVLVVLNKINVHPFDLNRRALQQKYPFIRGFVSTDCEDRSGIEELRAAVERETDQLKHLRDAFPAAWFAIKDKLASMKETLKRDYLSFPEYRHVCEESGENDPQAQESLAFYLHNLGIALNYRDDPRLRDTHVLNPRWVTNGIYGILNSPRLAKQKGEIRLQDVTEILDSAEYPRHMHRFLFDLMKKFELCFTFPDDDAHYLIPELLDKQEPADAARFKPAECLSFEYRYPVLPEGLLPRFIVRTHALSCDRPRWRTGVVLAFEGNEAIVKADVQDKRVSIAVSGPATDLWRQVAGPQTSGRRRAAGPETGGRRRVTGPETGGRQQVAVPETGRRRLLAVIRSDLERIHADIRQLRPEALVPVPRYPGESVPYEDLLVMEREGEKKFKKPIRGRLVEIDVQQLLNGVDLEGTRKREEISTKQPVRLFYSYSHKDETLRNELETHLKLLQRTGLISVWHDRNIDAGDDWRKQIDENLERADIILLLVSADFIASDYCYEKEMKRALERHEAGEARVIPIIVRDVNWARAPFAKLQALPKDARAVMEWSSKDAAWRSVSEGIERIVQQMRGEGHTSRMG